MRWTFLFLLPLAACQCGPADECRLDDDCGFERTCEERDGLLVCVGGELEECRLDEDCADGERCALIEGELSCVAGVPPNDAGPGPVTIDAFTVDSIDRNDGDTLTYSGGADVVFAWESTNAAGCTFDDPGPEDPVTVLADGTITLRAADGDYTLDCEGETLTVTLDAVTPSINGLRIFLVQGAGSIAGTFDEDGATNCGEPTVIPVNGGDAIDTVTLVGDTITITADATVAAGPYAVRVDCDPDDVGNPVFVRQVFRLVQEVAPLAITEDTATYLDRVTATWDIEGADSCALQDADGNEVFSDDAGTTPVVNNDDEPVALGFPARDEQFQLVCLAGADAIYQTPPTDTVELTYLSTLRAETALDNTTDALRLEWSVRPNPTEDVGVNLPEADSCALQEAGVGTLVSGQSSGVSLQTGPANGAIFSVSCADTELEFVAPPDITAFFGDFGAPVDATGVQYFIGNVAIGNVAGFAFFDTVEEISGNFSLVVGNSAATEMTLNNLRKVGLETTDVLSISNSVNIATMSFDGLESVAGNMTVSDNGELTSFQTGLQSVGTGFTINNNDNMTSFQATALSRVGDDFNFTNNDGSFLAFNLFPFPDCDGNQENSGTGALACARIEGNFTIQGNPNLDDNDTGQACGRSARLGNTNVDNNPAACQ